MDSFTFPSLYQEFIYTRTYAKWREEDGRRERFPETVKRYEDFFLARVPVSYEYLKEYHQAIRHILTLDVMPSMRALWSAGKALELENVAGYNCSYTIINSPKAFAEILYILMCGTGVGFSVEEKYINRLPAIPPLESWRDAEEVIVVEDSRKGWAESFLKLLEMLYAGVRPKWDLSLVRPKGSRLRTFGGRASGPEPLDNLFRNTVRTFEQAAGRKLTSLECFDIICDIADCVVVGGVRRSALIALTSFDDDEMAQAKMGAFWEHHPNRRYANISAVYNEKPRVDLFLEEWTKLIRSGTGERGIANRAAMRERVKKLGRRRWQIDFGTNPCGEIILRPFEFCNLTEVVVRPWDTLQTLLDKVQSATILGVLQSTLDQFDFLSPHWRRNVQSERLLGVSLTGLRDHHVLGRTSPEAAMWLRAMRERAILTARIWSAALGINMPAAITCVKPSGTVSQLVNASSGIHPRYSQYYIRRVRVAATDPLAHLLLAEGVPAHPEVGEDWANVKTIVFEFPVQSPPGSVLRNTESAIEQLEYFKMVQDNWCEHNASNTIYVKDHEWMDVAKWVWENFDNVCGLTFLPYDGGVYPLAPYEEIDREEYERRVAEMPKVDFSKLSLYEKDDNTIGSRELACVSGACELI